ncbi:MAG: peptide-methionine (S)-S-oxide reductase MsrA [Sphingomicrobium sp.]
MTNNRSRAIRVLTAILMTSAAASCSRAAPSAPPRDQGGQRAEAVFAGGCFWCTESDFDKVPGVISTVSGYTGGKVLNPTYKQVSGGNTGHIESLRVVYDPARVSYATLVEHLYRSVDPVDAGGQFCDRGYQYRSAVFVSNAQERRVAEMLKAKLEKVKNTPGKITTLILPRSTFYPAEGYHQDYYKKNPLKYRFYRLNCGRDARIKQAWGSGGS